MHKKKRIKEQQQQQPLITILYIACFEFLLYNVLHSVRNIYIGRWLLKNGCHPQQLISVVAIESLVPDKLTQIVPETQSF